MRFLDLLLLQVRRCVCGMRVLEGLQSTRCLDLLLRLVGQHDCGMREFLRVMRGFLKGILNLSSVSGIRRRFLRGFRAYLSCTCFLLLVGRYLEPNAEPNAEPKADPKAEHKAEPNAEFTAESKAESKSTYNVVCCVLE
jgi:hypothetical protein